MDAPWMLVRFAYEADEDGICPCGWDYAECSCPGPTQDDLYEYIETSEGLFARPHGSVSDAQTNPRDVLSPVPVPPVPPVLPDDLLW